MVAEAYANLGLSVVSFAGMTIWSYLSGFEILFQMLLLVLGLITAFVAVNVLYVVLRVHEEFAKLPS